MKVHEISISDPMFFEGPDGPNRILAKGVGVVRGPDLPNWQKEDYLLEVLHPFDLDGEEVRYLLVSPRYVGDTIEDAMSGYCIVGIGRVRPNVIVKAGDQYSAQDTEYWAIGSIKVARA